MKKWILGIMVGLSLWPMISFGQTIGDIDVSFCNSGIENDNYFTLVTEAGKTENVCVNIRNVSENPVSVHIDFVDGGISDGGESACLPPDYPVKEFSKYISNNDEDVDLQGGGEIQKIYKLEYPIGFSGLSHGCISYYINSDKEGGEGISMVFRKVNIIDVLVGGTKVASRIKIRDVFYTGDVAEQKLGFEIENNGNIDQEVTITGFIQGRFGYQEDFDLGSFKLGAGKSVVVYTKELHLPSYKGLFHINSYISNQPSVDFSIAHSNIYDNEYSVAATILATRPFFLWSILYVALIVLVLVLIIAVVIRVNRSRKFVSKKYSNKKK